jgi:hypothetical protein
MAPLDSGHGRDLVVGAPGDSVGACDTCGSVTVLLGAASGLTTAGAGGQRLHQDTPGVPGTAESSDRFGVSVSAPRIQRADRGTVLVGAPQESFGRNFVSGAVHQFPATGSGPAAAGSRVFTLDTAGLKGTAANENQFGLDLS